MVGQAVGHKAGHEIDEEVTDRAMAGVFDLTEVFQFIEDSLDEATAA